MFMSGKQLFMYRFNKAMEFVLMLMVTFIGVSSLLFMWIAFN